MFTITGITGNVGGEVARALLAAGLEVRGVVRNASKSGEWAERGCTIAQADINDGEALSRALEGTEGAFVMVPPNFDPEPGFPEAQKIAAVLRSALSNGRPKRVVYLSTIGAQATRPNLLTQHSIVEKALRELPLPITFLRPAWFMENFSWDVASARSGIIASFLQPLDRHIPMVATADIGRTAAELLREDWDGHRVVELEGPRRVSPNEVATTFAELLGHPVKMETVPRATWEPLFRSQDMKNPQPRIQMLDGFNEGWIDFEGGESGSRKGVVEIKTVLKALIERQNTVAAGNS
jgi:uncharacterized protein YbjT (DUF2867 family)